MSTLLLQLLLSLLVLNLLPRLIRLAGPQVGAACASFPIVGGTLLITLAQGKTPQQLAVQTHAALAGLAASAVCAVLFASLTRHTSLRAWSTALTGLAFFPLASVTGAWLPTEVETSLVCAALFTLSLGSIALTAATPALPETCMPRQRIAPWLRQAVPMAMIISCTLLRPNLSVEACGLLASFPMMSLLTFTLTQIEQGTGQAQQLARAYPLGNLAAIVFYGVFGILGQHHSVSIAAIGAISAAVPCSVLAWKFSSSLAWSTRAPRVDPSFTKSFRLA